MASTAVAVFMAETALLPTAWRLWTVSRYVQRAIPYHLFASVTDFLPTNFDHLGTEAEQNITPVKKGNNTQ